MKSEIRNPKSERSPKSEARICGPTPFEQWRSKSTLTRRGKVSDFGFRPSFGFRISAFGFPFVLLVLVALISASAQTADDISRIREEGLERSKAMETLSYLTEAIGPRLTGSPNLKRANEWTRDQLVSWGLTNAALEPWGPFGRGWALKRFSAQIVAPNAFPLIAYPKA